MKNCRWNLPRNLAAIWLVLSVSTTHSFVVAPQKSIRLRLATLHPLAMVRIPFLGGKKRASAISITPTETREPVVPQTSTTTEQQLTDSGSIEPQEEGGAEEKSETEDLMQKIKDSGLAGVISYALWELAFWAISVPVCIIGYQQVTGHLPDLNNKEDIAKLSAEAFAFVNFARFAVPLRIGTYWYICAVVARG